MPQKQKAEACSPMNNRSYKFKLFTHARLQRSPTNQCLTDLDGHFSISICFVLKSSECFQLYILRLTISQMQISLHLLGSVCKAARFGTFSLAVALTSSNVHLGPSWVSDQATGRLESAALPAGRCSRAAGRRKHGEAAGRFSVFTTLFSRSLSHHIQINDFWICNQRVHGYCIYSTRLSDTSKPKLRVITECTQFASHPSRLRA